MNQLNKFLMCFLLSLLGCILCSCSFDDKTITESASEEDNTNEEISDTEVAITEVVTTEEKIVKTPTKEEVLEAHEIAFAGMDEKEVDALASFIHSNNLYWEHDFFYYDKLVQLEDPNSLQWNIIDQTGDIQVGWAYDDNMEYDPDKTDMSQDEYNQIYGTKVMSHNDNDASAFIEKLTEIKETVQSQTLIKDLDDLIENMRLARETHDVQYIWNVFHILHDLDYFLVRYGKDEFAEKEIDNSFVSIYYGTLHEYQ